MQYGGCSIPLCGSLQVVYVQVVTAAWSQQSQVKASVCFTMHNYVSGNARSKVRVPFELIDRETCRAQGTRYLIKNRKAYVGTFQDFWGYLYEPETW
jgi:hypothetical protein